MRHFRLKWWNDNNLICILKYKCAWPKHWFWWWDCYQLLKDTLGHRLKLLKVGKCCSMSFQYTLLVILKASTMRSLSLPFVGRISRYEIVIPLLIFVIWAYQQLTLLRHIQAKIKIFKLTFALFSTYQWRQDGPAASAAVKTGSDSNDVQGCGAASQR